MTKLLLARHGHVQGIHPERFRGRADLPLTADGVAEAQALAQRVAAGWKPAAVYTSPLQRCVVTGDLVARACGLAASPLEGLMDIDYGTWQMRTHDEVKAEAPHFYRTWRETPQLMRFPGGESLQDVAARTVDVLRLVIERHPADTVVLVGHDSANRTLLLHLLDLPLSAYWRLAQSPCCLNEIDIVDGVARVSRLNDTSHLESGAGHS